MIPSHLQLDFACWRGLGSLLAPIIKTYQSSTEIQDVGYRMQQCMCGSVWTTKHKVKHEGKENEVQGHVDSYNR